MQSDDRNVRITKLSRRIQGIIRTAVALTCALIPVVGILRFLDIANISTSFDWWIKYESGEPVVFDGPIDFLVWGLAVALGLFLLTAPLYHLDRLLSLYRDGTYFAPANTLRLRRIGQLLIAQQVMLVLVEPLAAALLFLAKRSDSLHMKLSFEYNQGAIIAVSAVIILLAHLMGLAHEALVETELTV
jgi:hypothetical protein